MSSDAAIVQPARRRSAMDRVLRQPSGRGRTARQQGQTLVEFALIFPLFMTLMLAVIEFAFLFNSVLSTDYLSRDAALTAAEAGDSIAADCLILRQIESAVTAPVSGSAITSVRISWENGTGKPTNTYVRSSSTTCPVPGSTSITVPYSLSGSLNYPATSRCNVVKGCSGRPLDIIGVSLTLHYTAKTPLKNLVPFANGYDLVRTNSARMEPVL
jgi:Flp pilus assembly protein TadG